MQDLGEVRKVLVQMLKSVFGLCGTVSPTLLSTYVNHVMIWIWLSSFRDTGADNLTRHGSDPAFCRTENMCSESLYSLVDDLPAAPGKMKKHQAVGDST